MGWWGKTLKIGVGLSQTIFIDSIIDNIIDVVSGDNDIDDHIVRVRLPVRPRLWGKFRLTTKRRKLGSRAKKNMIEGKFD